MKTIYLNPRPYRSVLTCLILIIGIKFKTTAQNIGVWTLNNTLTGTGTAFNNAGNLSLGSGIGSGSFNSGTEYYGENGWPAGGINTNAYIQFSLSPISGYMVNISTLTLRMRRSNTGSPAGSGPTAWAVRSSLDGFTSNIATGTMTHNYANYTVTPSAFTYLTSTITFRIYGYTTTVSSGGNSRLVVDNISVQGATGTLPVHFSLFNARKTATGVELKWNASSISAGTKFAIERSVNGIDFTDIKEVEEKADKSFAQYSFNDQSVLSGKSFYRIRATELSGLTYRTAIATISNKTNLSIAVEKVMVANSEIYASLQAPAKGVYTIAIISMNGSVVFKRQINLEEGINSISIFANNFSHGAQVLMLQGSTGVSSKKFVY